MIDARQTMVENLLEIENHLIATDAVMMAKEDHIIMIETVKVVKENPM